MTDADVRPIGILLVEDSASDAALLQESLAQSELGPFEFTHVECWADAAARLRQDQFEVLILDLTLPDTSGRDTFIRARAAAPHLPIVVLSGMADEAAAMEALRHGIQDYLVKGQADGPQTVRAIRYAIERHRTEQALKQTEAALRESERQLRETNLELERRVAARTVQLEETVADLEDFSHSITHDLRAPLRTMRAFAQILQEECGVCAKSGAQQNIQLIINAAARMDRLIQDVLQYSRTARSDLPLVPVDVAALLRGIIQSYPAFQSPGVQIELQEPLPRVLGNEAALTQCFSNLLGNAVKFVTPGVRPRVRIWAERVAEGAGNPKSEIRNPKEVRNPKSEGESAQPVAVLAASAPTPQAPGTTYHAVHSALPTPHSALGTVRLFFADNGIGIPQQAQERIFKLFQRLDKSYEGTGVGLAVVRKAAEKMGGRVGLESEPGQGSCFWLELQSAEPSN